MVESGEADLTPSLAVQDATNPHTDFALPRIPKRPACASMRRIPPLNDVRVRKALNMAIDWDGMGEALFGKDVLRGPRRWWFRACTATTPAIKPWPYNPDAEPRS